MKVKQFIESIQLNKVSPETAEFIKQFKASPEYQYLDGAEDSSEFLALKTYIETEFPEAIGLPPNEKDVELGALEPIEPTVTVETTTTIAEANQIEADSKAAHESNAQKIQRIKNRISLNKKMLAKKPKDKNIQNRISLNEKMLNALTKKHEAGGPVCGCDAKHEVIKKRGATVSSKQYGIGGFILGTVLGFAGGQWVEFELKNKRTYRVSKMADGGKIDDAEYSQDAYENYLNDLYKDSFSSKEEAVHELSDFGDKETIEKYYDQDKLGTFTRKHAPKAFEEGYSDWSNQYAQGGKLKIRNQYYNHTPAQVWDGWNTGQRLHFLNDHKITHAIENIDKNFDELETPLKQQISTHVKFGQYENGGSVTQTVKTKYASVLPALYMAALTVTNDYQKLFFAEMGRAAKAADAYNILMQKFGEETITDEGQPWADTVFHNSYDCLTDETQQNGISYFKLAKMCLLADMYNQLTEQLRQKGTQMGIGGFIIGVGIGTILSQAVHIDAGQKIKKINFEYGGALIDLPVHEEIDYESSPVVYNYKHDDIVVAKDNTGKFTIKTKVDHVITQNGKKIVVLKNGEAYDATGIRPYNPYFKRGGVLSIEEETDIMPNVAAREYAEMAVADEMKAELDNYKNLHKNEQKQLDKKYLKRVNEVVKYLVEHAETTFLHSKSFRADLIKAGDNGPQMLHAFMEHWAGRRNGQQVVPVNTMMETWYKHKKEHKFEQGGTIKISDTYPTQSPQKIWRIWSQNQRLHFLYDHADEILNVKEYQLTDQDKSWFVEISKEPFTMLNTVVRQAIKKHIKGPRYEKGGALANKDSIVIIYSEKAPLSSTLQALTGQTWNAIDFEGTADDFVEKKTGVRFVSYRPNEAREKGIDGLQVPNETAIQEFYDSVEKNGEHQTIGLFRAYFTNDVISSLLQGFATGNSVKEKHDLIVKIAKSSYKILVDKIKYNYEKGGFTGSSQSLYLFEENVYDTEGIIHEAEVQHVFNAILNSEEGTIDDNDINGITTIEQALNFLGDSVKILDNFWFKANGDKKTISFYDFYVSNESVTNDELVTMANLQIGEKTKFGSLEIERIDNHNEIVYENGGKIKCPVGTQVQSLLFDIDKFTIDQAKEWAKKHDYYYGDVDTTENYHHLRQQNPDDFTNLRTIEFTPNIKAVIGCPKNHKQKGGHIGFDALAAKVAKRYKGKHVKAKYQRLYGKTYDAHEANEVGQKVAAKVYREQQMANGGKLKILANHIIFSDEDRLTIDYINNHFKDAETLSYFLDSPAAKWVFIRGKLSGIKNLLKPYFILVYEIKNNNIGKILEFKKYSDWLDVPIHEWYHKIAKENNIKLKETKQPSNTYSNYVHPTLDATQSAAYLAQNILQGENFFEAGGPIEVGDSIKFSEDGSVAHGEVSEIKGNDYIVTRGLRETLVDKSRVIGKVDKKWWHFKNGGEFGPGIKPTTYEGKTPEQVWQQWSRAQRVHFLIDHFDEYAGQRIDDLPSGAVFDIQKPADLSYNNLSPKIKEAIELHIEGARYEYGGQIYSNNSDGELVFNATTRGGKHAFEVRKTPVAYYLFEYTNGSLRGSASFNSKYGVSRRLIESIVSSKFVDGINYIINKDDLGITPKLSNAVAIYNARFSDEFAEWEKTVPNHSIEELKENSINQANILAQAQGITRHNDIFDIARDIFVEEKVKMFLAGSTEPVYETGGKLAAARITFTSYDYDKLMGSNKFMAVDTGAYKNIIDESTSLEVGKYFSDSSQIMVNEKENSLYNWLFDNAYLTLEVNPAFEYIPAT